MGDVNPWLYAALIALAFIGVMLQLAALTGRQFRDARRDEEEL